MPLLAVDPKVGCHARAPAVDPIDMKTLPIFSSERITDGKGLTSRSPDVEGAIDLGRGSPEILSLGVPTAPRPSRMTGSLKVTYTKNKNSSLSGRMATQFGTIGSITGSFYFLAGDVGARQMAPDVHRCCRNLPYAEKQWHREIGLSQACESCLNSNISSQLAVKLKRSMRRWTTANKPWSSKLSCKNYSPDGSQINGRKCS